MVLLSLIDWKFCEGRAGKYDLLHVTLPLNPLPREEDLPSLRSKFVITLIILD